MESPMESPMKAFVCPHCSVVLSDNEEIRLLMDNPSAEEVGVIRLNTEVGNYEVKRSQEVRQWNPGNKLILSCPHCKKNLQHDDDTKALLYICYGNNVPDLQIIFSTIIGEHYTVLLDMKGQVLQKIPIEEPDRSVSKNMWEHFTW